MLLVTGCGQRVLRHNGTVNMGGNMKVDGKMAMDGELKTVVSLDNDSRATALRRVTVAGKSTTRGCVAILDVDDFLVNRTLSGIGASGENPVALFREKIDQIIRDDNVRGVVLRINSPGGGVTASDIVSHELQRLKQTRPIPVAASIASVGTGGAYYLATHCDTIVAHPTSIVGGIGVILNVYNLQDTMGQFNVLSSPIKSGERIDAGTPERPLDAGEMEMLQRIADNFHQRFIERVQIRRPQAAPQSDQWSDGRVMTGDDALAMGLVDQVGYLDAAVDWVKQQAELQPEDALVLYRRGNDPAYTPLDSTSNQPAITSLVPLRIPGLDRSSMPTFLYMWQADPAMASLAHP